MFTGIIEEIGTIEKVQRGRHSATLTIRGSKVLEHTKPGDSIAVNGICLTVTELLVDYFVVNVMHETLNRSSLSQVKCGMHVNLERAMPMNGRFGGHIVSGHVDGIGKIVGIKQDDIAVWYTIQAEKKLLRYVVEKGSVAIDGISLTVAQEGKDNFLVSVIPHTKEQTILKERQVGDIVNLETDVLGKYVEKLLPQIYGQPTESRVTKEFLLQHGF